MDKYFYKHLDVYKNMHLYLKKKWNPNQKHPSYKKVVAKTWKRLWWKDVKGGGQGLCRNAIHHIKNFDNDDPGHKTLGCLGHHYQKF